MSVVRYHLVFKGQVQGVGFRFTTQRIAKKYRITGWVRNNPDWTVEVVAEGEKERLDLFLEEIKDYFKGYISDYELKISESRGEFKDFQIVFY